MASNFAEAFLGARDNAMARTRMQQEDQNRSALSKLYGDYYSAQPDQRQAIVPEIARRGGDPFALEQASRQQQASMREELVNRAKLLKALPPQHRAVAWQRMAGDVARMVGDDSLAQLPYDPATFDPMIDQLVGAGQDGITVRSSFVGQDGNMYSIMSDGSVKAQGIGADRKLQAFDVPGVGPQVVDLRNATARTVTGEGGPQSYAGQPPADPMSVLSGMSTLAQTPGVTTTSLYRDPAKNARVGGIPNSQHPQGTAGDFVVPPQAKAAFMAQARALGFEAIDEGDHVHVELPPGGMAPQAAPAGGDISRVPINQYGGGPVGAPAWVRPSTPAPGQTPPSGYRFDATGNLAPIPGGPHDPNAPRVPTATERKDMNARRMRAPQLQNAERGIERIEAALGALEGGTFGDTGPIDALGQRYTRAGKELEAAVGGMQNSLLSLTRVPGIGSQSDLEARIALLQYPTLDQYPENNRRTIANLRQFVADLRQAYASALAEDERSQGQPGTQQQDAPDDDALIQQYLR